MFPPVTKQINEQEKWNDFQYWKAPLNYKMEDLEQELLKKQKKSKK
jgi:hypothetical protein